MHIVQCKLSLAIFWDTALLLCFAASIRSSVRTPSVWWSLLGRNCDSSRLWWPGKLIWRKKPPGRLPMPKSGKNAKWDLCNRRAMQSCGGWFRWWGRYQQWPSETLGQPISDRIEKWVAQHMKQFGDNHQKMWAFYRTTALQFFLQFWEVWWEMMWKIASWWWAPQFFLLKWVICLCFSHCTNLLE